MENYINSGSETTNIAIKRSCNAKHLVNSCNCANNYNETKFKIIRTCVNFMDLIKLEAIFI